jgi:hypothetical protein
MNQNQNNNQNGNQNNNNNNRNNNAQNNAGNVRSNMNSGNNGNNGSNSSSNISSVNNQKKDFNPKKENAPHSNMNRNNRIDFHKKPQQRYNPENFVTRIANPKREESVDDIKIDIEKLEKDIQFEVKQIRSVKLGL